MGFGDVELEQRAETKLSEELVVVGGGGNKMDVGLGIRGFHGLRAVREGFGRRFRRQNVDESAIHTQITVHSSHTQNERRKWKKGKDNNKIEKFDYICCISARLYC